jgi:hypothetical protein
VLRVTQKLVATLRAHFPQLNDRKLTSWSPLKSANGQIIAQGLDPLARLTMDELLRILGTYGDWRVVSVFVLVDADLSTYDEPGFAIRVSGEDYKGEKGGVIELLKWQSPPRRTSSGADLNAHLSQFTG